MKILQKKENSLMNIDKRICTFENTIRSTYEILRTTKLKQDCIEAMMKNGSSHNDSIKAEMPQKRTSRFTSENQINMK